MNKKRIQNFLWSVVYSIWVGGTFVFASVVIIGLPLRYFASDAVYNWLMTSVGSLALAAVVYVVATAIVFSSFLIRKMPLEQVKERLGILKRFQPNMLAWAIFIWGLYFLTSIAITAILYGLHIPGLQLDQQQDIGFSQLNNALEYGAAFVLLVLVAPFFEELLFRGYLFGAIRHRAGFVVSTLLTSFTFALMHGQLNVGIDVFILSLFLCYLRERFDSVWPGMVVHSLKNGLAYIILFILPLYGISLT